MIDEWVELKWATLFLDVGGTKFKRTKIDQSDHFNN